MLVEVGWNVPQALVLLVDLGASAGLEIRIRAIGSLQCVEEFTFIGQPGRYWSQHQCIGVVDGRGSLVGLLLLC